MFNVIDLASGWKVVRELDDAWLAPAVSGSTWRSSKCPREEDGSRVEDVFLCRRP